MRLLGVGLLLLLNVATSFHFQSRGRSQRWALRANFEDLSYRELQAECKRLGLKSSGNKGILVDRLTGDAGSGSGQESNDPIVVPEKMSSSPLEASLSAYFDDESDSIDSGLLGSFDNRLSSADDDAESGDGFEHSKDRGSSLLDDIFSDLPLISESEDDMSHAAAQARHTILSSPPNMFHTIIREYSKWLSAATKETRGNGRDIFERALLAYRRGGQGGQAESVLRDMSEAGLPPVEADFELALQAHVANGDVAAGLHLLKRKSLFGVETDSEETSGHAAPYLAMLHSLMFARDREAGNLAALQVIDEMRQSRRNEVGESGGGGEDDDERSGVELEAVRMGINAATRLGDWRRALSELSEARGLLQRGAKVGDWDPATLYVSVMSVLMGEREVQRLLDVFAFMEEDGVDPNGTGYGLAISAAGRLGARDPRALQEAIRLLVEAHELRDDLAPSPVDTRAYLAVIEACRRAEFPSGAAQALGLAVEAGMADEQAFEYAISAAAKAKRPEQARQHLAEMRAAKVKPTLECFNSVISAYEQCKRLREALPLLEEMRIEGIDTDVVTYNVAMRACASKSDWARAYALMNEMAAQGVLPTLESYKSLIASCTREQNAKRAVAFLEEMGRKGVAPDLDCYNAALRVCVERDPGRAVDVMGDMVDEDLRGDGTTVWVMCRLKEAREEQVVEDEERLAQREADADEDGVYDEEEELEEDEDDEEEEKVSTRRFQSEPAMPVKRKRMSAVHLDAIVALFNHYGPGGSGIVPKEDNNGGGSYRPREDSRGGSASYRAGGGQKEAFGGKRFGRGGGRGGTVGGGIGGGGRPTRRSAGDRGAAGDGGGYRSDRSARDDRSGGGGDSRAAEPAISDNSDFLAELQNLMK